MLGLYFNQQFNWCCKKQLSSFRLAMFTANKCDLKVVRSWSSRWPQPSHIFIACCLNRQQFQQISANKCEVKVVNLWCLAEHWTLNIEHCCNNGGGEFQCPMMVLRLALKIEEHFWNTTMRLLRPCPGLSLQVFKCYHSKTKEQRERAYIWRPCWRPS